MLLCAFCFPSPNHIDTYLFIYMYIYIYMQNISFPFNLSISPILQSLGMEEGKECECVFTI